MRFAVVGTLGLKTVIARNHCNLRDGAEPRNLGVGYLPFQDAPPKACNRASASQFLLPLPPIPLLPPPPHMHDSELCCPHLQN